MLGIYVGIRGVFLCSSSSPFRVNGCAVKAAVTDSPLFLRGSGMLRSLPVSLAYHAGVGGGLRLVTGIVRQLQILQLVGTAKAKSGIEVLGGGANVVH